MQNTGVFTKGTQVWASRSTRTEWDGDRLGDPKKGAHHLACSLGPSSPQGSLPRQVQGAEPASRFQAGGRHCRARRPETPHCGKTSHSILIFLAGGIRQGGLLNPSQ